MGVSIRCTSFQEKHKKLYPMVVLQYAAFAGKYTYGMTFVTTIEKQMYYYSAFGALGFIKRLHKQLEGFHSIFQN